MFRPLKHILSVFVFRKIYVSSYFLGPQFLFYIYIYIGLNFFKCTHKINYSFFKTNSEKMFRDPSHQLSVALFIVKSLFIIKQFARLEGLFAQQYISIYMSSQKSLFVCLFVCEICS